MQKVTTPNDSKKESPSISKNLPKKSSPLTINHGTKQPAATLKTPSLAKSPLANFWTKSPTATHSCNVSPNTTLSGNAWRRRSPNVSFSSDTPPKNLAQVMSEQLAEKLNTSTEQPQNSSISSSPIEVQANNNNNNIETDSDAMLAKLLQTQFDKEYNRELTNRERRLNGSQKVVTSLQRFKIQLASSASSDDSHPSEDDELQDMLEYEEDARYFEDVGLKLDFTLQGRDAAYDHERQEYVSKHDLVTSGRKNAQKMEAFPLNFNTGDTANLSLKNNIFNSLKQHAHKERRQLARNSEQKDASTAEHAVDSRTRLLLYKMVNAGVLEQVNGVISIGKEAIVLHARGGTETPQNQMNSLRKAVPENIAIKVFKTTMGEFRHRDKYIADDYRFQDRFRKINAKKLAYLWAEKECRNLERLETARIPCPEVVLLRKHLLLLRFIGNVGVDGGSSATAAPKLSEIAQKLSKHTQQRMLDQVLDIMKRMYQTAKLVHADLSEFNLLWHENQVVVIDTAQAVEPQHPKALEFLYRDCCNITKFFGGKLKLQDVPNARRLLLDISQIDMETDGFQISSTCFDQDKPSSEETAEFTSRLEEIQARARAHAESKRTGDFIKLDDERIIDVQDI